MKNKLPFLFIALILLWGGGPSLAKSNKKVAAKSPQRAISSLSKIFCEKQVFSLLENWQAKGDWKNIMPPQGYLMAKITPTETVGEWIETYFADDKSLLVKSNVHHNIEVEFKKKDCHPNIRTIPKPELLNDSSFFTDKDLNEVLLGSKTKNKAGMFYIWSPYMPLSVKGLAEAKEVAEEEGIDFVGLLDQNADLETAKSSLRKYELPEKYLRKSISNDFIYREVTIHFPTYFMFKNGEISTEVVPGYDYAKEMREFIKRNK